MVDIKSHLAQVLHLHLWQIHFTKGKRLGVQLLHSCVFGVLCNSPAQMASKAICSHLLNFKEHCADPPGFIKSLLSTA